MAYVYVLLSLRNGKRYTGSTRISPDQRLKQHNNGSETWTRQNGPFQLIYREEFKNYSEARKREIFLKSGVGRKYLNEKLGASAKGGSASG